MKRLALSALGLTALLTGCAASSVGVIGGADGPTSIVVSGPGGMNWALLVGVAVVGLIAGLWFGLRRRKK